MINAMRCNAIAMRCTPEEREQILDLAEEHGYAEASKRTGVPVNTLRSWASRHGRRITTTGAEQTVAAAVTKMATMAERKAGLADKLIAAAHRMADDMFAPTVEHKAMAAGAMRQVEIVEVHHPTTTAAERRTTAQAIAATVETVQLLTGQATERIATVVERRPEMEQELAQVIELVREAS